MRKFIKLSAAIFALCLCASCRTEKNDAPATKAPPQIVDSTLSTNWSAAVIATLPAKYKAGGDLSFQQATNALARESRRGNLTAQSLWGFAMLLKGSGTDAATGINLMKDAAQKGVASASLNLGFLYLSGVPGHKDYNEAFHWFTLAAEKGDPEGQLQLGGCYHYGQGTTPNPALAAKYYRLAAEQTNYVAMKSLGFLLMGNAGMETNLAEAKYWLTRAAKEGGNRRAMLNLGAIAAAQYPDTNAMVEAFQWYQQGAELGDALAALELANFYNHGWGGVETNLAEYRYWRFKAAIFGSTEAQYLMGDAYRTGDGLPVDPENSLNWYRKAAAKNDPRAIYNLAIHYVTERTNASARGEADALMLQAAQLGHLEAQLQMALGCFKGEAGSPDFENGKLWLLKAAEGGWPRAEFFLFEMLYNGISPAPGCAAFPIDRPQAVQWLHRAAEHGFPEAQSILGVMLIRGMGVEPDKIAGEQNLRSAAMHGLAKAQNDLGFAIMNGDCDSTNLVESAMWLQLAEAQAEKAPARSEDGALLSHIEYNLKRVMARLSVDQKYDALRQTRYFEPIPVRDADPLPKGWQDNPSYQREDGIYGH